MGVDVRSLSRRWLTVTAPRWLVPCVLFQSLNKQKRSALQWRTSSASWIHSTTRWSLYSKFSPAMEAQNTASGQIPQCHTRMRDRSEESRRSRGRERRHGHHERAEVSTQLYGRRRQLTWSRFYKRIEDAYIHANKTLLRLMLEEQQLIPHLRFAPDSQSRTSSSYIVAR